ncbi:MAG: hypothetical protein DYG89_50185 [Caldilinea sp. CFX5]|nr:hypothetical protein [Caldilinea sp. CFX5]
MNAKYPWIFVVLFLLLAFFLLNPQPSYAQEDEGGVATQTFTLRNAGVQSAGMAASTDLCTVTAELRWYKTKKVKVMYHWQHCTATPTVYWELASIQNASGAFVLDTDTGLTTVYYKTWPDLKTGDRITLHTWLNDAPQPDVVTEYKEVAPIWVKIHTRQDSAGACFQFTGHVDPWGVFTAGDHSYVFALSTQDWETPWVAGPHQPTVDWHVQFYQDAQLTQLRTEYWFNNVANPCYTKPPVCEGVTLSLPNGSAIAEAGADVDVTIRGDGAQYRIVDQRGQVIAGPSATAQFKIHALPDVVYQGQVYGEQDGWTNSGCQFQYGKIARPVCHGITLQPSTAPLPLTGQQVQVTINGENGARYQIVAADGQVVAGPSEEPVLTFLALPAVQYQAQVYNETYGWTTDGCSFQYDQVAPPVCHGVTLNPPQTPIPATGQQVEVTVAGENASEYRIVDAQGTVVAGPSATPVLSLLVKPNIDYQAQLYQEGYGWTTSGCIFRYDELQSNPTCDRVELSIANGAIIPAAGAAVQVTVHGREVVEYRLMNVTTNVEVGAPSTNGVFTFHAMPHQRYQAQVRGTDGKWTTVGCEFGYVTPPPPPPVACQSLDLSVPNGAFIPRAGEDVVVTVHALNAIQYRIVGADGSMTEASADAILPFHALPAIGYQVQVVGVDGRWSTEGCQFSYQLKPVQPVTCTNVVLSVPNGAAIAAGGAEVAVTVSAQNATLYQIVDEHGQTMAGPGGDAHMQIHAMPHVRYQAQVANADQGWTTTGCDFTYTAERVAAQAFCELRASHYGDPGGRSQIKAWVKDQTTPVAIEKVRINWNQKGEVTYPTKRQAGPWFTNSEFTLLSRPEVFDVGFGYYKYEAWVYIAGIAEPAYCWGDGNAPDHDNVLPDPGPFAKPNPEGKLNRGNTPSRLPTVGRLPFDGGNGPDKVELILWAFEKEGRGINAKITAIANDGKPLARLGMSSVSAVAKFDGLNAREGIVYGFQIGEHGPWGPLFCPKPDNDPTTITVYWAAGGLTWLSDGNAYGDCWWLTVAAALNGWVTVDESVATYNALQPIIDWNGHRNLVFSLAQSRETGLGPRMQDAVIGLQAREWQGPVLPTTLPADFTQTVDAYRAAQAK